MSTNQIFFSFVFSPLSRLACQKSSSVPETRTSSPSEPKTMQTHSPLCLRLSVSFLTLSYWCFESTWHVPFTNVPSYRLIYRLFFHCCRSGESVRLWNETDGPGCGAAGYSSKSSPVSSLVSSILFLHMVPDLSLTVLPSRSRSTAVWWRCPLGSLLVSAVTCPRLATL